MKKNSVIKLIACLSALALIVACFAACGKHTATEVKASATELTLKNGETAYFAVVANYEDGVTGSLEMNINSDDTDGKITETSIVASGVSEESTYVAYDENDEGTTGYNLEISDSFYLCTEEGADFTADDLGEDVIKFITENSDLDANQTLYVCQVKAIGVGTENFSFTSGDTTLTVKFTVTE